MNPTWRTFYSICWESRASTCFEQYLRIFGRRYTNGIWYACNIPNSICAVPPEDKQVMLETCRGLWFSINLMESASRWFHYTDIHWRTVSKTLSKGRSHLRHTSTSSIVRSLNTSCKTFVIISLTFPTVYLTENKQQYHSVSCQYES
jgi:hypothetical protein